MNKASFSRTATAGALLMLAACAGPSGGAGDVGEVYDPLEGVNRAIFSFNDAADRNVIEPVAQGYTVVVPDPFRDNIRTLIRTLTSPLDIANNLLQGDFNGAGTMTARTLTNVVLGLGFNDVATAAGIGYTPADMGQTFAVWGADAGPYIVIPLLGPSNVRDAIGMGVDSVADPLGWVATTPETLSKAVVSGIDTRSRYLKEVDEMRRSSLDYYATMRSLSVQSRQASIQKKRGPSAQPEFPNYDASPSSAK